MRLQTAEQRAAAPRTATGKACACAVGYKGTAARPSFNYSFKDEAAARAYVANFFDNLKAHKERVVRYREEANKPHTFKVGDIVVNSWGYDQTNVDWYTVTRATARFVWVKPIAGKLVNGEEGFMSGRSVPVEPVQLLEEKEEQHHATGEHVTFKFGSGSKWDGKPRYTSWYA
jgi:hypothetical protein